MSRLFFFIISSVFIFLAACQQPTKPDSPSAKDVVEGSTTPNVILIYADDLGYGDLSSYGAEAIETPNVDRLAKEGLRFTHAHSTASTCTPSRYSLMTGDYAFRQKDAHILPGNASLLVPQDRMTLGKMFQKAGYTTGIVGKWHIGLGPQEGPDWNGEIKPGPNEVGFDYSFIFPATADRVPTVFVENHKVIAMREEDPIEVSYEHKIGNEPTGQENPDLLKMKASHGHDGTIVNGIGRIGWMTGGKLARWSDEELPGTFLAKAKDFIRENKEGPFFLYYPVIEPHVPRMPNTRFKGKSKLGYRGDVILQMDAMIGEMMQTLKDLGLDKNTIIVFSSDNGPVLDDGYQDESAELAAQFKHRPAGPFRGGKYSLFEGGTRIPMMIRWPDRIKPGESDALVSQMDILASFAQLLDVDLKEADAVDSQNFLETFLGESEEGRSTYVQQNNGAVLTLVKEDWKYIEPAQGPALNEAVNIETGLNKTSQLYNLKEDKKEEHNLAETHPDKVEEMARELEDIRKGNGTR